MGTTLINNLNIAPFTLMRGNNMEMEQSLIQFKRLFTDFNNSAVKNMDLEYVVYLEFNNNSCDVLFSKRDNSIILGTSIYSSIFEKDIEKVAGFPIKELLYSIENKIKNYVKGLVDDEIESLRRKMIEVGSKQIGNAENNYELASLKTRVKDLQSSSMIDSQRSAFEGLEKQIDIFVKGAEAYNKLSYNLKLASSQRLEELKNNQLYLQNIRNSLESLYIFSVKDFSKLKVSENVNYNDLADGCFKQGSKYLQRIFTKFV